jgi:hypothetical protein
MSAWPFRKMHQKGKRAVNQRQSHRQNVRRELRGDSDKRIYERSEISLTEEERRRVLRWADTASGESKLADDGGDDALIAKLGGRIDEVSDRVLDAIRGDGMIAQSKHPLTTDVSLRIEVDPDTGSTEVSIRIGGEQYAATSAPDADTALRMAVPYIAGLAMPDPFADVLNRLKRSRNLPEV